MSGNILYLNSLFKESIPDSQYFLLPMLKLTLPETN
jgi:hypothetical protein